MITKFGPIKKQLNTPRGSWLKSSQTTKNSLKRRAGSFLVEGTVALSLLVAIAIILLSLSIDVITPRVWVIRQNLADAYLTREVALGNSMDFDIIAGRDGNVSPWPVFPANTVTNNVVIGTLNNGQNVTATLTRTRILRNSPGTPQFLSLTDLGISMWELQSHLSYTIGGDTYVKSRTMVRTE